MRKIFCAYADDSCAYSLKRIDRQAKSLGVFDAIKLYTPEGLSKSVRELELMKYKYGGGYWAWKPFIIHQALEDEEQDAVVCYADAGCSLRRGLEWTLYFELMKAYDVLCFKYRDIMPEWEKFGTSETSIRCWGKKNALLFFDAYTGDTQWRNCNKVMGGLLFFRGGVKRQNPMLQQWMGIVKDHPEVIIDPSADEMSNQYPYFAQHKHDMVVLTALAYANPNCLILPELCETCKDGAVRATRYRCATRKDFLFEKAKRTVRTVVGGSVYDKIKGVIKSVASKTKVY